jgi:hypothetical protein
MKQYSILLLLCLSLAAHAQRITFGPLISINSSGARVNKGDISSNPILGGSAGAFARVRLLKMYLQPEVMYSWRGANLQNANGTETSLRFETIEANLMGGLQVFKFFNDAVGFRLHTGPGYTAYLPSTVKYNGNTSDEFNYRPGSINWQFGLGFDIFNLLLIDFRYVVNNSNMVHEGPAIIVPKTANIQIAYKLIKQK